MIRLSLIMICLIFSTFAFARKPAVEPVVGLALDERPAPQNPAIKEFKLDANNEIAPVITQKNFHEKNSSTPLFFMLFMFALPFVVWFGVLKTLKTPEEKANVASLSEHRKRKEEESKKEKKAA